RKRLGRAGLSISTHFNMTRDWPCVLAPSQGILRQIISNFVPYRAVIDEGMVLRTDAGIIVEGSHANGNLIAFRPIATKQTGAAIDTKRLNCALSFSVNVNQAFALQ